jgi:carboxypeptidase family protein/TonB-dependent receptor-like protein
MIPGLRAIIALAASVAKLGAQTAGTVLGTVTATNDGAPLPFAQVSVMGTKITAFTASDGGFVITEVPAGTRVLQFRLAGFKGIMMAVNVTSGDTAVVRVALAIAAIPLAPVQVTGSAAPRLPAMRGFEERRAHAQGHYLNREEIVRMQARRFTDLLRRIPGVQLQRVSGPYEQGEAVRMSRTIGVTGARACPVLYYVNGTPFPVTGDVPIDHFIAPEEVAALEVYSGMSQIPSEFNSASHNARCGVIVIWTLTSLDTLKTQR